MPPPVSPPSIRSAAITKLGLAVGWLLSAWLARPSDVTNVGGWVFAAFWCAIAWLFALLLLLLAPRLFSTGAGFGGLCGLALGEAAFDALATDPLLLLVKPLLLAVPLLLGAVLGHFAFERARSAA